MVMRRFNRKGRTCVIFAGNLVVAGIALVLGGRCFLASQLVSDRVSERLSASLGMPVQIGRVEAGWSDVSLQDVRLFEPEAGVSAAPFAVIDRTRIDLSLNDLLHGDVTP